MWYTVLTSVPSYPLDTHAFNGPLSGTTWVSQYQKGKTDLDFTEARDSEWQASAEPYASLHVAPDRQPHQHPTTQIFTGRVPFLPPNQQSQSTEGCRHESLICIVCGKGLGSHCQVRFML